MRESRLPAHRAYGWLNVRGEESRRGGRGSSISNPIEARAVAALVARLEQAHAVNGVAATIGVIAFYSAQVREIFGALGRARRRAAAAAELTPRELAALCAVRPRTTVATVDAFQGAERDIMVLSFVRTNRGRNVGFLKDFRRLNVALTRAKHSLICVGDVVMLRAVGGDLGALVDDAAARGRVARWREENSGEGAGGRYVKLGVRDPRVLEAGFTV